MDDAVLTRVEKAFRNHSGGNRVSLDWADVRDMLQEVRRLRMRVTELEDDADETLYAEVRRLRTRVAELDADPAPK